MKSFPLLTASLISFLTIVSCQSSSSNTSEEGNVKSIRVNLEAKSSSKASGTLTISELSSGGIQIKGHIRGLAINSTHGFHFHENGDCSDPEAAKAGGHFNPDKDHKHGKSIASTEYSHQHAGDLGNIVSNKSGDAVIDFTIKSPSLTLEKENKYSLIGRSLVVHADKDDEKSSPAGNAGKRILCGVIKP